MAMVVLSERHGADARLVAVMQYLRLVIVVFAAVAISRAWLHAGGTYPELAWFALVDGFAFAATLLVALGGAWFGQRLRIPAGALLLPLAFALLLRFGFGMTIALPEWFLALVYTAAGWRIGLGFTRDTMRDALRALPVVALSIIALVALCGGIAWLLTVFTGIDGLSAYLATSPGGLDSVAIIAVASHVDVGFVFAMQIVRFLIVLILGARLSAFVAKCVESRREVA